MILKKVMIDRIVKLVKNQLGFDNDKYKFRRIENELRSLSGRVARMEKNSHPRRELVERKGKYYLEEKSEKNA